MSPDRYLVRIQNNDSTYLRIYRENPSSQLIKNFSNVVSIRFENSLTPKQIIEEVYKKHGSPSIKGELKKKSSIIEDFKKEYSGLVIPSRSRIKTEKILKFLEEKFIKN